MKRAIALFLAMLVIALFALLNWPAFSAVTPLSLGVTTVYAPLGLIMLGLVVFVSVLFSVWAFSMQASALRETRRMTKDLQAQRDLADKAEASRFTELRAFFTVELARVAQANQEANDRLLARMDRLQNESNLALEQTSNTLSAYVGELEDRMERHLPPAAELSHGPGFRR
jgi:biopolymer transport protein ExbB/TolQ